MESKKPWQSKTILLNSILAIAGGLAPFVPGAEGVIHFVNSNAVAIGAVWGVLNAILRFVSKEKISLGD